MAKEKFGLSPQDWDTIESELGDFSCEGEYSGAGMDPEEEVCQKLRALMDSDGNAIPAKLREALVLALRGATRAGLYQRHLRP